MKIFSWSRLQARNKLCYTEQYAGFIEYGGANGSLYEILGGGWGEAPEIFWKNYVYETWETAIRQAFSWKIDCLVFFHLSSRMQDKWHESNAYCQYWKYSTVWVGRQYLMIWLSVVLLMPPGKRFNSRKK